ncbi:MAG: leucine-rich repeat domain-containing protein, partial [Rikenellaceae bacterium]
MKKKLLFLLFTLQLTLPLTALASTITVNNITYETNNVDMTASVTGYSTTPTGDLVLPNTVSGIGGEYTITSIGSSAFSYCSSLSSIALPEGVTEIGWGTFGDCSSLTSIVLPENLTAIDSEAFYGCSQLTDIKVNWETPL